MIQANHHVAANLGSWVGSLGAPSWQDRRQALAHLPDWQHRVDLVPQLLGGLANPHNAGLRNACADALVTLGEPVLPQLGRALAGDDPEQRKRVVEVLGRIGGAAARALLQRAPIPAQGNLRVAVLEALHGTTAPLATELTPLLRQIDAASGDLHLQGVLLAALARGRARLPWATLEPWLRQPGLRRFVYPLLARCHDLGALLALVQGLGLGAFGLRRIAAAALLQLLQEQSELARRFRELALRPEVQVDLRALLSLPMADSPEAVAVALNLLAHSGLPALAPAMLDLAARVDVLGLGLEAVLRLGAGIGEPLVRQLLAAQGPAQSLYLEALEVLDQQAVATELATLAPRLSDPEVRAQALRISAQLRRRQGAAAKTSLPRLQMADFGRLRAIIHGHSGIVVPQANASLLENRLRPRLATLGLQDFAGYASSLEASALRDREMVVLMNLVTVNESYFFREQKQLRSFMQEVVPQLLTYGSTSGPLQIWSAGCAAGEEPYTLAMLLMEQPAAGRRGLKIVGSDIADRVLRRAAAGVYRPYALRETPADMAERYFDAHAGAFTLRASVRPHVRFRRINLVVESEVAQIGTVDAIFCRNVMIYFDRDTRLRVLRAFYRQLRPGGFLMLGHSESLLNLDMPLKIVPLAHDIVYQRPLDGNITW